MNSIKIGGMFGVSKDKFDLPEGWCVSGCLSNKGILYSLRTVEYYNDVFGLGFFTEQEINTKILVNKRKIKINERKIKINEINENKTSNNS